MAAKVKAGQPVQAELFSTCLLCGSEHVIWRDDQVAPVEVVRKADGSVLICLWDGRRSSVWIEMSEGGRRWLGVQLLKGLWTRRTVREVRESRYAERVRIRQASGFEEEGNGDVA